MKPKRPYSAKVEPLMPPKLNNNLRQSKAGLTIMSGSFNHEPSSRSFYKRNLTGSASQVTMAYHKE